MIVSEGTGEIYCDGKTTPVGAGAIMYCAGNTEHGITNSGNVPMTFYWSKWLAKGFRVNFAHLTLPTEDVERTAAFLEKRHFRLHAQSVARELAGSDDLAQYRPWPGDARDLRGRLPRIRVRGRIRAAHCRISPGGRISLPSASVSWTTAAETTWNLCARTPHQRFFFREPVNGFVFRSIIDQIREPR